MAPYSPTAWLNNAPPPLSAANLNKLTDELEAQAAASSPPISHSLPTWADGVAPALTDAAPLNEMERVTQRVATALGSSYTPTVWSAGWTPTRNAYRFNRLEQQVATNSVMVTPPPASTNRGFSYLRYGDGELPVSHIADYDFVVTSWGGAPVAGASSAKKVLHYMSAVSCKTGASGTFHYGVTSEEVRANNWVLLDSGGAEMTNYAYGGSAVPLGNPGLAGYQQRWASNVAARLQATGCDGVFIDDTLFWTTGISNGQSPQSYPTPTQWVEAMRQWMSAIGIYLNARGYYVVANAGGWYPGSTDYNGTNDLALWTALAPHLDGLNSETWMWHPASPTTVRTLGAGWNQNWDGWLRLATLCEQQGIDFHCISASTSSVIADYNILSALLVSQGTMYFCPGGVGYSTYDRNLVWHATYDRLLTLGNPTGLKYQSGSEWRRQFSAGLIWVNPTNGTAGII